AWPRTEADIKAEIARLHAELEALRTRPAAVISKGSAGTAALSAGERQPRPQRELEQRFHGLMKDLYLETRRRSTAKGKPYWSNYFNRSVAQRGGLEAARRYLAGRDPQDGFQRMIDLGLEDISVEAVVLQAPWRELFTAEELATARRRLR